jgi:hypothetical protein
MRMISNQSSRFSRSLNYTVPEYRTSSLHSAKSRLSLVAPTHAERGKDKAPSETTKRR